MKIAVYTIAKDEEKFAKRWADSAIDADYRIVLDTGSTDSTVKILKDEGVWVKTQTISPWRFDVARNESMAMIPDDVDVCICLDMDEILVPGWRQIIEHTASTENANRFRYRYVWSWKNGEPDLTYYGDKIHLRDGFEWVHPVHEVLRYRGRESQATIEHVLIQHHPDHSKSRGQYLPLLELAVKEDPEDDRNAHYLGREYHFNGRHEEAITELERHLSLPRAVWEPERAASLRYISKSHFALGDLKKAKRTAYTACLEHDAREQWLWLANLFYHEKDHQGVIWASSKFHEIEAGKDLYLSESDTRNHTMFDMVAMAYYGLGMIKEAIWYTRAAISLSDDESDRKRLEANLVELVNNAA